MTSESAARSKCMNIILLERSLWSRIGAILREAARDFCALNGPRIRSRRGRCCVLSRSDASRLHNFVGFTYAYFSLLWKIFSHCACNTLMHTLDFRNIFCYTKFVLGRGPGVCLPIPALIFLPIHNLQQRTILATFLFTWTTLQYIVKDSYRIRMNDFYGMSAKVWNSLLKQSVIYCCD